MLNDVLIVAAGYLIGSIPSGYLVGRFGYGIDIRQKGSGNIGSTNVRRVLGFWAGILVLALDALKGGLVVLGAAWLSEGNSEATAMVIGALAVICGNMFSVFLRGKGGKGVGVALGVALVMAPEIVGILLIVWLAVRQITHYVSAASLTIACLFPALMWIFHRQSPAFVFFGIIVSILVVSSHRANIKRLMAGEEIKDLRGGG